MYYRVISHGTYAKWYKVQVWRWWFPVWWTARGYLVSQKDAAEFIRGYSTYYDGAE